MNTRVILHREKERKQHVKNPKKPANEFAHSIDNFENYVILSNFMAPIKENVKNEKVDEVWQMYFDGAYSKAGKGAGIVIISPSNKIYNFAFRLEFEASNNVVEYEALFIGLETTKDTGIKVLNIKGDSDLVILQLKNIYQCKSDRLRKYMNAIWDTMDWFDALNLQKIPREMNGLAYKLQ